MIKNKNKEIINSLIIEVLGIDEDELVENATFEELGADSLDEIEVVMKVEKEFNIRIDDDQLTSNIKTLGDFYDLVGKILGN